jgi:hypothetical protein
MTKKCRILITILLLISTRSHVYVESIKTKQEQSKICTKFQKEQKVIAVQKMQLKTVKKQEKTKIEDEFNQAQVQKT